MKKIMLPFFVAGTLVAGHAIAQENHSGPNGIHYITTDRPNYYRASKLDGVAVYNEQNQKIGTISEILVSREGKAEAAVIGVGGFLGIGEHDVAVPFNSIQWKNSDQSNGKSDNNAKEEDYPAKAVLPGATKDQLKNAPEFKYKS